MAGLKKLHDTCEPDTVAQVDAQVRHLQMKRQDVKTFQHGHRINRKSTLNTMSILSHRKVELFKLLLLVAYSNSKVGQVFDDVPFTLERLATESGKHVAAPLQKGKN